MPGKRASLATRLWARVDKKTGDCWLWTGTKQKPRGYGKIQRAGRGSAYLYAHRVAYALENGPIPANMDVHHACGARLCCNPAHLTLIVRENHLTDNGSGRAAPVPRGKALAEVSDGSS